MPESPKIKQRSFLMQTESKSVFLILCALVFLTFLLCDVFKIGNESGEWIFFNPENISNILNQVSINVIIAFGMTLVILIKGIDLSVGSIASVSGVVIALLILNMKVPLPLAVLLTLVAGFLTGAANGALISMLRVPPFIATLASMAIFRGLAFILTDGKAKFVNADTFKFLGNGFIGPVPAAVILILILLVFFHFLLAKTVFGRRLYFLGGNEEAARLAGINPIKLRFLVFSIAGACSAMGGILLASRLGSGSPNVGVGYEMDAIAATIVGGTSFSGGKGTIVGTFIGALIMGVISNGMNLLGISPYMQYVAKGSIILLAVIIDSLKKR